MRGHTAIPEDRPVDPDAHAARVAELERKYAPLVETLHPRLGNRHRLRAVWRISPPKYFPSVKDVCEITGYSESGVRRAINCGDICAGYRFEWYDAEKHGPVPNRNA